MPSNTRILVVDLEATCTDQNLFPRTEMETIEIGAVLCHADSLAPVAEFQTFIRPVRHPRLTPFCRRLTTITQEEVDGAPEFPAAMANLSAWLSQTCGARPNGGVHAAFASWGAYDWGQLEQDAAYHGVALPGFVARHNLKARFAAAEGSRPRGMGDALRRAGLPLLGTHHRGIDDARNIARLMPFALGMSRLPGPLETPRR